ncbi:MAG: phenylalanine--tRNA ligase subunit beta [bacterium]
MKVSYNWLQSYFKKKLPNPEKLADLLTMHSFETDAVGKEGSDYVLDVDISPNRSHDCLCHFGVAQEISVLLKEPIKEIDYSKKIKEDVGKQIKQAVKIEVKDKDICPRYTARVVDNIKVGSSPKWIQERLIICGLRPINSVVDIANYVMLETGQPLHAFDADKLETNSASSKTKTIIIRRAKKGERIITLDDGEYDLDENILVIADQKKPICIAGIKGGKLPEIDMQTKRVVLESASFSPKIIRQASRQLKLITDASVRFEHEFDRNITKRAIDMTAYLIQDISGGQILNGVIDIYSNKTFSKKIILDTERVNSLLGIDISVKEIKKILEELGFVCKKVNLKQGVMEVIVPTRRLDVSIPEDLIEEVGRFYGLEKITSELPSAVLIPTQKSEDLIYQNKSKDILIDIGFSEVYNYSFVGEKEISIYSNKPRLIELDNPISQEQKYLRPSLMLNLIKNIRENKKYFEEVRLFEIGRVFKNELSKSNVKEEKRLAGIISLNNKAGQADEFYMLKGVFDMLLNRLRISDQWYDDKIEKNSIVPDFCHSVRRAEIKVGNDCLGWLAEINNKTLDKMDIKSRVAGFDIDFEKLVNLANEERAYLTPSKYPAIVRDISILADQGTMVVEALNLINSAGGPLVCDVDLFDMYEGEGIPDNKKNLAFHIIFQSDDHTLTDKEVNKLQDKIIKALENEAGWEVRKQN